jgi:glycosyltransferase involved in cell wall biosynthesis
LRLLVLSQYFWPENFRINNLVAELVLRGHDVTVLTGVPNYPDGRVFPEYRREPRQFVSYSGAKILRVPLIPRGRSRLSLFLNYLSFAATASLIGIWKLRRLRFDAVFVYQTSPVTVGLPAVLLRAIKRVPLAFWVLDLWPDTLQAIGVVRSRWLLRSVGLLVSFIYNRCDLILTPSRSSIPQIAKRCRNAGRIAYFPSWAESVFDCGSEAAAPELPPKERMFDVMFAGNIGQAQDFPAVLAAAELLKGHAEIRWLIVGDGRMAPWVAKEIERRNLEQRVLMLGSHPLERMPAFYRHADALLVCLKDEPIFSMTIPGKLQSYLTAGIPVVAMLNGEGAEVVKRSHCGVTCRAGDAQGLAAAVLSLAQSPEEQRRQMGRNALVASETEFDRSRLITQLESWLQGMSARARGNANAH